MLIRKTFNEITSTGGKIRTERFYYPNYDCWVCANCFHAGSDFIIATIPCNNCENGMTKISVPTKTRTKYAKPKQL